MSVCLSAPKCIKTSEMEISGQIIIKPFCAIKNMPVNVDIKGISTCNFIN